MELYYNIVKNVYKTYTKRINSVYKFLIELALTTSTSMIFSWDTNLSFLVLLRTSALYLSNQSVPSNKVFDVELITCRGMKVWASAITIDILSTTFTAACGLPFMAITFFLVDSFHLRLKATARGLVTTDMH